MWRNKNAQRAQARLRFCVVRAAEGGEAYTDLLCAVKTATQYYKNKANIFLIIYFYL